MEKEVIASRIKTPDGTILWSRNVHDYVTYQDTKSGEVYMLDGGNYYMRTSVNKVAAKNMCVYNTAKWKTLREYVIRETCLLDENMIPTGKVGYVRLSDMSDSHLDNLKSFLEEHENGQKLIGYITREQKYRANNGITIAEHDYTNQLVNNIQYKN